MDIAPNVLVNVHGMSIEMLISTIN